jgi:hypothetical protein
MSNKAFFKKWYTKHKKEIKKYIKDIKSSDKPLSKMSTDELKKYLKAKIRIWELLTSRNQDRSDEYIDEMTRKELLKDLIYYEEQGMGQAVEWMTELINIML